MEIESTDKIKIFQQQVRDYHNICLEIENAKRNKNELSESIISFIKNNKLEKKRFVIGNRVLRCASNEIKGGLTQKLILDGLIEYFDDESQAKQVLSSILIKRNIKSQTRLILDKVKKES